MELRCIRDSLDEALQAINVIVSRGTAFLQVKDSDTLGVFGTVIQMLNTEEQEVIGEIETLEENVALAKKHMHKMEGELQASEGNLSDKQQAQALAKQRQGRAEDMEQRAAEAVAAAEKKLAKHRADAGATATKLANELAKTNQSMLDIKSVLAVLDRDAVSDDVTTHRNQKGTEGLSDSSARRSGMQKVIEFADMIEDELQKSLDALTSEQATSALNAQKMDAELVALEATARAEKAGAEAKRIGAQMSHTSAEGAKTVAEGELSTAQDVYNTAHGSHEDAVTAAQDTDRLNTLLDGIREMKTALRTYANAATQADADDE